MVTEYERHKAEWIGCRRCPLCETRSKVVLARGRIPCDALLVGEAPGPSENRIGSVFVGPAGKLLDRIIDEANRYVDDAGDVLRYTVRIAFTNLVACIPLDPEGGGKFAQPPVESILACAPRLVDFARIAQPKLVVAVGALAEQWTRKILEEGVEPKRRKTSASRTTGGRVSGVTSAWAARRGDSVDPSSGERFTPLGCKHYAALTHPAAILRMNVAQQGLAFQRAVVQLGSALEDVFEELG